MDPDALQRTLDAIDAVTQCGWCKTPLTADGPSLSYCSEEHQERWFAHQTANLPAPLENEQVNEAPISGVQLRAGHLYEIRVRLDNQVLINGHAVPIAPRFVRPFVVDEIASIGASFGAAVAFPRLADLMAERALEQEAQRHRRLLEEDWMFTDPTPVGEVFAQLGEFIPGFLDGIHAATSQDGKPPADPRARALWLRQNRNTGPTPRRQRPPKNLTR